SIVHEGVPLDFYIIEGLSPIENDEFLIVVNGFISCGWVIPNIQGSLDYCVSSFQDFSFSPVFFFCRETIQKCKMAFFKAFWNGLFLFEDRKSTRLNSSHVSIS